MALGPMGEVSAKVTGNSLSGDGYQRIYEQMPVAYVLTDSGGQIQMVNLAAGKLLDQPREALRGQSLLAFFNPGTRAHLRRLMQVPAGTALPPRRAYLRLAMPVPVTVILGRAASPTSGFGEFSWILYRGYTAKPATTMTEEPQHGLQANDEFLDLVAHEFGTPLTSLRGFTQLALRRLGSADTARHLSEPQLLKLIEREINRLVNLLAVLLDAARVETDTLAVVPEVANISSMVEEIVVGLRSHDTRHSFVVSIAPGLHAMIDPRRMPAVFSALLDNACKFSPRGGEIEVILNSPDAQTLRLVVRDHGLGIPPELRPGLFTRYFRAHGSNQFAGLGLSLYIARHVVQMHHGRIEAEYPSDGGMRFVVTLPR